MDTAAWTAGLTWATWLLVAAAVLAAYFAYRTWMDTKRQLAESHAQTAEVTRQADAATRELNRAMQAEERLEAQHVAAWLRGDPGHVLDLCVRNGNSGPVYDVRVSPFAKATAGGSDGPSLWIVEHPIAVLPPAASEPLEKVQRRQVPPDSFVEGPGRLMASPERLDGFYPRNPANAVFSSLSDFQVWDGSPLTTGIALELTFRDSAGVQWKRDWHGELRKLS